MKRKFTLIMAMIASVGLLFAQQVDREKVILEIGTGTWCQFCPGAAMGADDMIENGHAVAVIENHNGDSYANVYSNARNSYYGITGYPTSFFDGTLSHVGGSTSTSIYNIYLPLYNQRKSIPSSFTIDMDFEHVGLDYTANITVTKVATASSNIVLHLVLTESHIEENWQGQDHLNFVTRLMAPNQYGSPLDFSGGDEITLELDFTMNASWVTENCELVAFVQDVTTKEILQGTNMTMATPDYDLDAELYALHNVPDNNCSGMFSPSVTLKNWGAQNLSSVTINYMVNNGEIMTHDWTGNLEFLDHEMVTLEPISFEPTEEGLFKVYLTNPNGAEDENHNNDTINHSFEQALAIEYYRVSLLMKTDANPDETSYEVLNSAGNVVYSAGSFTQPNHIYKDTFNLYTGDCYQFIIYDEGGDGLVGGFYTLREAVMGGTTLGNGDQFGYVETSEFQVDWVGVDETELSSSMKVYPNPTQSDAIVFFELKKAQDVSIKVYNVLGEITYEKNMGLLTAGEHMIGIDKKSLSNGINFIVSEVGTTKYTEKILVK